ncbi:hypothetical protein COCSADRAFT_290520 [Bipolaris sorokiniana ND90Pr]|uniref:Uncharacterized protein n=1 Tax=Cochliobolus sativus (strain ND90Pr / ATCC 201652) TaxID=665912 RepID=M2TFQ3_COCSN|nr:uncharacterized protein COCSADRAFT_290520 [Bipolaris sorokiniana ND90Pr]EMD67572.1 hypothetical protein COCSADRAFT_290520 [Bipolaris sorokiniana ND90Pr]
MLTTTRARATLASAILVHWARGHGRCAIGLPALSSPWPPTRNPVLGAAMSLDTAVLCLCLCLCLWPRYSTYMHAVCILPTNGSPASADGLLLLLLLLLPPLGNL